MTTLTVMCDSELTLFMSFGSSKSQSDQAEIIIRTTLTIWFCPFDSILLLLFFQLGGAVMFKVLR